VITAWFAISDASVDAGCMKVMPGSHVGETLSHEDTYDENNMLTRGQSIGGLDESRAVFMPLRAGEMSLHNYCLAHGSGPNVSPDRRIGVSMHFMPPGTKQVVGSWDCAALVRGEDRFGNFVMTPRPVKDFDPVEQLIGPDILCWSTIFWIKDAGSKSFVSWHQDNTYWGLSSRNVITAWFAISDASVDAGCMKVMPGSHEGETLSHEDTYDENNMLTRGQSIGGLNESRAVFMPLRAGEMSLHNYCLAHGSGPNVSPDRRIGVSMHFMPPGTKQVVGAWDCAALVRGEDRFGHFALAPQPVKDFDPVAVEFHAKAAKAMRDVLYAGAEKKLGRL
jgi:ectoine hydroxylase-related dioxygenase (phytanoyl-CoA dioxygenase family)